MADMQQKKPKVGKFKLYSGLSEEERRAMQKEIQVKVREMQKQGKSAAQIKEYCQQEKRRRLRDHSKRTKVTKRPRDRNGSTRFQPKEKKLRPWEKEEDPEKIKNREELARRHDVVIIPIFFRRNAKEMETVLHEANVLKNKLMKHRINTWIDQRTSLLPGQKYEFWESVDVKFRLELGPNEVKTGTVCLSKSVPGDLAQRWKDLPVGVDTLHDNILSILKEEGLSKIDLSGSPCEACEKLKEELKSDQFQRPPSMMVKPNNTHKTFGHDSSSDEEEDGDDQENRKAVEASGDSLEGNYIL